MQRKHGTLTWRILQVAFLYDGENMTEDIRKKIHRFFDMRRIWDSLSIAPDLIEIYIDEWGDRSERELLEYSDKAFEKATLILTENYSALAGAFEKLSPDELKEFGIFEWTPELAVELYEYLTEWGAPDKRYKDEVEYFRRILIKAADSQKKLYTI